MQSKAAGWMLGVFLLMLTRVSAAPCTSVADCTEWLTIGSGPERILLYRSFPLETKNTQITRVVVVIHGAGRDADNYFRHMTAAAFLAGALENTLVISPRYASTDGCADKLAEREANWPCGGVSRWTSGGASVGNPAITSFGVMDQLLKKLAEKKAFPNLNAVVLTGHSAGGQFVNRYQMSNHIHESLGVQITYIVSNPSWYTYLDAVRPSVATLSANVQALSPGYVMPLPERLPEAFTQYPGRRDCTAYDDWPYGIQKRVGYTANATVEQLKRQVSTRPAIYLLGGLDILPLFGFDGSCSAMAQGPTRLARGLAFKRYANERLGAKHEAVIIQACGHNGRCMFTDNAALDLLFGKPQTKIEPR